MPFDLNRTHWPPRVGDTFSDETRGAYRVNGVVHSVLFEDKEVVVKFYTRVDGEYEYSSYEFWELKGRWSEKMEGFWLIE